MSIIIKVRTTKDGVSFTCPIENIKSAILVNFSSKNFMSKVKKIPGLTLDFKTQKVILLSSTAGVLVAEEGDYLVQNVRDIYYPTKLRLLENAINALKA